MANIREIISTNITNLRKEKNWTQIELARRINFSDKAVSRWEKGEVMPDIETIQKLSEVFDVPMTSIIEKQKIQKQEMKTKLTKQEVLSQVFLVCEIWTILSVAYAYLNISSGLHVWKIFLWGVPATVLLLYIVNLRHKHNISSFVYGTIFIWAFTACLFIQMINLHPWFFFILGIPIQGMLVIRYLVKHDKIKKENKELRN